METRKQTSATIIHYAASKYCPAKWIVKIVYFNKKNEAFSYEIYAYPEHGQGRKTATEWAKRVKAAIDPKSEIMSIYRGNL